jgi:O-antigen/teichoic acid export membrane protein
MWRRVTRDAAIVLTGGITLAALQVAFRWLAIGNVSVDVYGRAAFLLGVFNTAAVIGRFGLANAAARLSARSHGRRRNGDTLRGLAIAAALPTAIASIVMGAVSWAVTHSEWLAIMGVLGLPPLVIANYCMGFIRGKGWIWASSSVQPANLAAQFVIFGAAVAAGVHVGLGWIMGSYYLGNLVALLMGVVFVVLALRKDTAPDDPPDPEARPRRILGFSVWLGLANAAVITLALIPRLSLAHVSYSELAFFDVALLVYTLPQRLKGSFLLALVPIAAAEHKRGTRMNVPGVRDIWIFTAMVGLVDLVLWRTHLIAHVFDLLGMPKYVAAEPIFLIVLLALPPEIFYGLSSSLLQAVGQSKRLGIYAVGTLALSAAAAQLGYYFGPKYLAAVLVGSYWVLWWTARPLLAREGIGEVHVFNRYLPRTLRRGNPTVLAASGLEREQ